MKNWSGHIYFSDEFHWKDLEKAFPEIWDIIAGETKQNQEEAQYDQITLELNLAEIRKDKKPIGYIKDGAKYRMVFPEDRKEMIIYRGGPSEEIRAIFPRHPLAFNKFYFIQVEQCLLALSPILLLYNWHCYPAG